MEEIAEHNDPGNSCSIHSLNRLLLVSIPPVNNHFTEDTL